MSRACFISSVLVISLASASSAFADGPAPASQPDANALDHVLDYAVDSMYLNMEQTALDSGGKVLNTINQLQTQDNQTSWLRHPLKKLQLKQTLRLMPSGQMVRDGRNLALSFQGQTKADRAKLLDKGDPENVAAINEISKLNADQISSVLMGSLPGRISASTDDYEKGRLTQFSVTETKDDDKEILQAISDYDEAASGTAAR